MSYRNFNSMPASQPSLIHQTSELDEEQIKKAAQADSVDRSQHQVMRRVDEQNFASVNTLAVDRSEASETFSSAEPLLRLQRNFGNRYVQRVVALARQSGQPEVGPEIEKTIQNKRGGGVPLESTVLRQMENSFQTDFSNVRIHSDAEADSLNRAVSAQAFATGQDIFFSQGAYNPGSSGGRELLAHELTHVIQQNGSDISGKFVVSEPDDACEREADQVAREVIRSETVVDSKPKQQVNHSGYSGLASPEKNLAVPETTDHINSSPNIIETNISPYIDRQPSPVDLGKSTHVQRAVTQSGLGKGKVESKIVVPMIQRDGDPPAATPSPPTRFLPPRGIGGRRIGNGVVEDIGSTVPLVAEIERILHPAFKAGGSQALASVRATYSNDNVRQNATNMIQGTALVCGPFIGETTTDNYRGDVTVSASMGTLDFERADQTALTTASQSAVTTSATGGITTGVTGQVGGQLSAGQGGQGAPSAGQQVSGQVQVSQQQAQSSTAGMGGATTRTVAGPPGSVLFSTTLTYSITHTFHWDPGTGWDIASLGLVPAIAAFMERDHSWGPYTAEAAGVRIRFPGADCPPE